MTNPDNDSALLQPHDFGPIYTETDLTRFPVEPWNTFSNLIFLIIIFVFTRKLQRSEIKNPFLMAILPVLFLGWIGGTIFHATRSHSIWLILDFVPIMIISLSGAAYLWRLTLNSWIYSVAITLGPFLLFRTFRGSLPLPRGLGISIGYIVLALCVITPAVIQIYRTSGRNAHLVICAGVAFIFAVTCRIVDQYGYLPMGTHFIWHLFGGVSTWLMFEFVYRTNIDQRAQS